MSDNKIAAMFSIDTIKKTIAHCPIDEVIILCPNWPINKPNYEGCDPEQEHWDFTEFEEQIGCSLLVTDYNDLVADPHGIY